MTPPGSDLLYTLRIPEGDIVVTRKVPMTDETCSQLRALQAEAEKIYASGIGVDVKHVKVELPTIIQQLVDQAYHSM